MGTQWELFCPLSARSRGGMIKQTLQPYGYDSIEKEKKTAEKLYRQGITHLWGETNRAKNTPLTEGDNKQAVVLCQELAKKALSSAAYELL